LEALVNPAILLMGFGMGVFNVGGLALMMGMSVEGQTGIYMGAWTLSQALANGMATYGGGLIHDLVLSTSNNEPVAYAAVFAIEAIGLVAAFVLLQQLSLARFQRESQPTSTLLVEVG
jgi:BCD family chlorophyll transporter-like MFS transporter